MPQIDVEVNLAQAQKLRPEARRRPAGRATLVAGEEVGDVFRDGRAYDVQVWSTPETRASVTSIQDLPIDTPGGPRVRLADVAAVSVQADPEPHRPHQADPAGSTSRPSSTGRDLGTVVDGRCRTGSQGWKCPPATASKCWVNTRNDRRPPND